MNSVLLRLVTTEREQLFELIDDQKRRRPGRERAPEPHGRIRAGGHHHRPNLRARGHTPAPPPHGRETTSRSPMPPPRP